MSKKPLILPAHIIDKLQQEEKRRQLGDHTAIDAPHEPCSENHQVQEPDVDSNEEDGTVVFPRR